MASERSAEAPVADSVAMSARIIALFEALTASDLEAARPTDLELFAALCRHWASLADLSREGRCGPPE
jgi:hypothetical protein